MITRQSADARNLPAGELVGVRLLPEPLAALDAWIAKQREELSRPEAIRRLVEAGLKAKPASARKRPE